MRPPQEGGERFRFSAPDRQRSSPHWRRILDVGGGELHVVFKHGGVDNVCHPSRDFSVPSHHHRDVARNRRSQAASHLDWGAILVISPAGRQTRQAAKLRGRHRGGASGGAGATIPTAAPATAQERILRRRFEMQASRDDGGGIGWPGAFGKAGNPFRPFPDSLNPRLRLPAANQACEPGRKLLDRCCGML